MWTSLAKRHKVGSTLKEGRNKWRVIQVIAQGGKGGYYATELVKVTKPPKKKANPLVRSKSGWIKAKAVKISRGKLLIKR